MNKYTLRVASGNGFIICPMCSWTHIDYVIECRNCGYFKIST